MVEDMALAMAVFPIFVVRNIGTLVGLRTICDQTCWDLLFNITVHRQDNLEVELFARFLQEFYDQDELLFFLYVKSVIGRVLRINFKTRWLSNLNYSCSNHSLNSRLNSFTGANKNIWMSLKECTQVARVVYGYSRSEDSGSLQGSQSYSQMSDGADRKYRDFIQLLMPHLVGQVQRSGPSTYSDTRRIDIFEYLHLSVEHFRMTKNPTNSFNGSQDRVLGGEMSLIDPSQQQHSLDYFDHESKGGGRWLLPLPGQVAPSLPIPGPTAELYSKQRPQTFSSADPPHQPQHHPLTEKLKGAADLNSHRFQNDPYQESFDENAPMDLEEEDQYETDYFPAATGSQHMSKSLDSYHAATANQLHR